MPWSSTTSSSENENSWMMDSPFLLKIWRRRDGQLLRLLNAQNLGQIKEEFDIDVVLINFETIDVNPFGFVQY